MVTVESLCCKNKMADTLYRLPHERITNKRHGTEYTTTPTFEATVKTLLKSNGKTYDLHG